MVESSPWLLPSELPPVPFVEAVRSLVKPWLPEGDGCYVAQLLWQRGQRDLSTLPGFLSPRAYQPASPFEFGAEMEWAIARLWHARQNQEKVAIWGDFDADGVTATAVLWDGLGQFFTPQRQLLYYIPNRLSASHGLSRQGIEVLHEKQCCLIVTCDTGSTNSDEILYAQSLGIDVIVTDHHTLPTQRPPVVAIINPRELPKDHALATLSGVAVAYKLVEALYLTWPEVPQRPLAELLDLVAIGLIADLVELKGDCRYLAQLGIEQLQTHVKRSPSAQIRPGITRLLELCKRTGDRPTDISFGIGPRINAVSRIQGDAHFCVELLTSRDAHLCNHLAEATELANARRKALQKDVMQQVIAKLSQLDLSTTRVIVLCDEQWHPGVLGLVAGQIAQDYNRPTILLSKDGNLSQHALDSGIAALPDALQAKIQALKGQTLDLAKGSARSINGIDLYQLLQDQAHLLHRFGGHPFAAGLSLPIENIPLFTAAINQRLSQQGESSRARAIAADLVVTVNALGKDLFQTLKLLEPCGMGNPAPKLLIQNCWFERVENRKIKDLRGHKVEYIQTQFELWDDLATMGFPGVWWGHHREEIPGDRCDVIAELESNPYKRQYEIRLMAVRPAQAAVTSTPTPTLTELLDWRVAPLLMPAVTPALSPLAMSTCPTHGGELQTWWRRATEANRPLAIAYPPPTATPAIATWQKLVGLAKYLSRTEQPVIKQHLCDRLGIGEQALSVGLLALPHLGFLVNMTAESCHITWSPPPEPASDAAASTAPIEQFLAAVQEEQFRRQYFYQVPLATLQTIAQPTYS